MGVVNKIDYLLAILKNKSLELQFDQIELDDKEIIRLGLDTTDILQVNIDHIEWQITEPLETYEGTKAKLPKINVYWDDGTITEETINYTMIDNVSYYLEPGNYELRAVYNNFTSTNTLQITVIKKELIGIEWENTNSITTQQNHRAYLPYIKLNYNDGNSKRISTQSPGIILNDSEYYLELGEHILTATYKEFTTNELIINVVEEDTYDYSQDYLTFEALEDGVFNFISTGINGNNMQYSIDNGITWKNTISGTNSEFIYAGTKILFSNNKSTFQGEYAQNTSIGHFETTFTFNISGNILSLIRGKNFLKKYNYHSESDISCFTELFSNSKVIHAKNLILGYSRTLPEIQNDQLESNIPRKAFSKMFYNCQQLIDIPKFPYCYYGKCACEYMFYKCISLSNTLSNIILNIDYDDSINNGSMIPTGVFSNMFRDCTSLVNAPELPATILANNCYENMFKGCANLVNAPELPATTLAEYCYSGMFSDCTSLVNAPELPATTLANNCYSEMFRGCSSLTVTPELPATILTPFCYFGMFRNCSNLIVSYELPALQLADSCYYYMFSDCSNLTTPPELPALQLAQRCYGYMFSNCVSLTIAPELHATILASNCYLHMFNGCININYIKAMFITTQRLNYTDGWVSYVAPSGTFVKLAGIQFEDGIIPKGWTVQEIDPDTDEIVNEYINR